MSSHHIVKDDQEPALIIANGASCATELMGQLLEWSPWVIVLDSAIERVLPLNIKVDVVLGDFDQLENELSSGKYDLLFTDDISIAKQIIVSHPNIHAITTTVTKEEIENLIKEHRG